MPYLDPQIHEFIISTVNWHKETPTTSSTSEQGQGKQNLGKLLGFRRIYSSHHTCFFRQARTF
jgi:hypothetical protein